ncbi:MAG TPA: hypothetical protein VF916_15025 [Ktedonobacterales bacterium]
MTPLTRVLDWIDEAAGGFIRLAYLAAGITAVALYFGAGHLPGVAETVLNAALPWTLAAAIEVHTYSTARRVRAAWQDHAHAALKVNLGILAGLLAFSSWNQLNYLAETWRPPVGALALPSGVAYVIRALIVPAAFMAAAFLAPLAPPIAAQLEVEARATLADVFRIARKQRRRRLKEAERSGRDMTAALVELVPDPEARRVIAHAYAAIGAPVSGVIVPATLAEATGAPSTRLYDASSAPPAAETPTRPPTGPGAPSAASKQRRKTRQAKRAKILQLPPPADPPGERVRVALAETPTLSVRALARSANVSQATASKWRRVVAAEQEGRAL